MEKKKKTTLAKPKASGRVKAKKPVSSPPPNLEELLTEIRARANEIYLARGNGHGDELSDWLQAEKEIKKKYNLI